MTVRTYPGSRAFGVCVVSAVLFVAAGCTRSIGVDAPDASRSAVDASVDDVTVGPVDGSTDSGTATDSGLDPRCDSPCDTGSPCEVGRWRCESGVISCVVTGLRGADFECRPSVGTCDVAETCSGTSSNCPADVVANAGTTCRASASACDAVEVCDGTDGVCPIDSGATCEPMTFETSRYGTYRSTGGNNSFLVDNLATSGLSARVGHVGNQVNYDRSAIEYDVSSIPAGATILSAHLTVAPKNVMPGSDTTLQLRVRGYVGDGVVTSRDVIGPIYSPVDADDVLAIREGSGEYEADVTVALQRVVNARGSFAGFELRLTSEWDWSMPDQSIELWLPDSIDSAHRAVLAVQYSTPAVRTCALASDCDDGHICTIDACSNGVCTVRSAAKTVQCVNGGWCDGTGGCVTSASLWISASGSTIDSQSDGTFEATGAEVLARGYGPTRRAILEWSLATIPADVQILEARISGKTDWSWQPFLFFRTYDGDGALMTGDAVSGLATDARFGLSSSGSEPVFSVDVTGQLIASRRHGATDFGVNMRCSSEYEATFPEGVRLGTVGVSVRWREP